MGKPLQGGCIIRAWWERQEHPSIECPIGDKHSEDIGRLHVVFRRENPTAQQRDFELLPQRKQKGRFVGSVLL
jgi:hypothetical protein